MISLDELIICEILNVSKFDLVQKLKKVMRGSFESFSSTLFKPKYLGFPKFHLSTAIYIEFT